MRPVDKGEDLGTFRPYNCAQSQLISRLGAYCSYCERFIATGIHVEHKVPQSQDNVLKFSWSNFLLACVNCNSAKSATTIVLQDYIWPDSDNTLLAFGYDSEGRVVPAQNFSDDINTKIWATWQLAGLNRHPDTSKQGVIKPTSKDRRWNQRRDEWRFAQSNKSKLVQYNSEVVRELIIERAKSGGFFSVWYTVFADHPQMRQLLVEAFKGTDASCFDDDYLPVHRPNRQI